MNLDEEERRRGGGNVSNKEATTTTTTTTTTATIDLRKLTRDQVKLMKPVEGLTDPFIGLKISDSSFLDQIDQRNICSRCGRSRKYFCYTCYIPLPSIAHRLPRVELPIHIDIIRHPREIAGKSTAIHAAILSPHHVTIHTHPAIPDYSTQAQEVVLIFPGQGADSIEELIHQSIHPSIHPSTKRPRMSTSCLPFRRAILIDCTWNQTTRILADERLKGLRLVALKQHKTLFWRYQRGKPNTYLATIEALYYFLVELHCTLSNGHCTLSNGHGTLSNGHCTLSNGHCTLSNGGSICSREDSTISKGDSTLSNIDSSIEDSTLSNMDSISSKEDSILSKGNCTLSKGSSVCRKDSTLSSTGSSMEDSTLSNMDSNYSTLSRPDCSSRKEHCTFSKGGNSTLSNYCGEYDNLLFFFKFMFTKIHSQYDTESLLAYKDC